MCQTGTVCFVETDRHLTTHKKITAYSIPQILAQNMRREEEEF